MTLNNNLYLYNLLLSSRLLGYDSGKSFIGPEMSLAYYLFKYSSKLFTEYPRIFDKPSIIVDTYKALNVYHYILSKSPAASNVQYENNKITFTYMNKYNFDIHSLSEDKHQLLYHSSQPFETDHNGVRINALSVDSTTAHCFKNYGEQYDLKYLLDASLMISLYSNIISNNLIFSHLLQLGSNIKKIMKKAMHSIKLLDFDVLSGFDLSPDIYKKHIHYTIGFCLNAG